MKIREELILKVLAKETVVELAEEYGVARKTIYKWLKRYQTRGLTGLVDESRRPNSSPMKTSAELALEIVQLEKEHMRWGPKKIATVIAKRHPDDESTPSVVTVRRVLHGVGLMKRTRRRDSGGLAHLHRRSSFRRNQTTCGPSTSRDGGGRTTAQNANR